LTGREAQNEYLRAWRKAHPENVKATRERYWENKARKHDETIGPIEGFIRASAREIETRKKTLATTTDPETRQRIEGEIRHLEEIRKRLEIPMIETREGGSHDAED